MVLAKKVVLITGASSGIGMACARSFASEGCNLILTARRKDLLDSLSNDLSAVHKVNVLPVQLDVRNFKNINEELSNLPSNFQDIDILVNNAGKALGTEKIQSGVLEN